MNDWLLDMGNTRWKLASRQSPAQPSFLLRADSNPASLRVFLKPLRQADRVFLASVADSVATQSLREALQGSDVRIVDVEVSTEAAGVRTRYDVTRLGVDRFLQLIAARGLASQAQLVVSVGTAMTVDHLDADGVHHGGWILPRAARIENALREEFPQLRFEDGQDQGFGLRTADAVVGGIAALQRGLLREAMALVEAASGQSAILCFCGGGAQHLAAAFDAPHHPWLALQGMARWADWYDAVGR